MSVTQLSTDKLNEIWHILNVEMTGCVVLLMIFTWDFQFSLL